MCLLLRFVFRKYVEHLFWGVFGMISSFLIIEKSALHCRVSYVTFAINPAVSVSLLHEIMGFVFRRGTHLYMLFFPSVRRASYLRNRTLWDHNFWYTCVK